MTIDASSLVCIVLKEPGYREHLEAIRLARSPRVSAMTLYEAGMVLLKRAGRLAVEDLRTVVTGMRIQVEGFDVDDAWRAVESYARFGKGISRVALNFGDGAVHALAEKYGDAVLSTTDEFVRAGLRSAI